MKKIILSTAILFLATIQMQSQWFFGSVKGNGVMETKTRNISDFDQVSVAGAFNVTLVHGDEGTIRIKMEENLFKYLITEVKDDKLTIRWKKGENISTRRGVHITLPFKDINEVNLYGSGDVICDDVIKTPKFNTLLTGSGDIILNVEAQSIKAKVTGSGNIALLGTTISLDLLVTGSGGVQSYKLIAENANAKVTGSGDIGLFVTNSIDAKVTGSGDITFKGNPKTQNSKITGSGDIIGK